MNVLKFRPLIFILLSICAAQLQAQTTEDSKKNEKSQAEGIPFIRFQYNYAAASGDLENRYGNIHGVGGAFGYKTKSNWEFEIEGNYLFSRDVKVQGLLNDIINNAGDVTDSDGELVKLIYEHRGLAFYASVGKVFNLLSPNPNSGVFIQAGVGYLQHKIKIDYRDGTVYQLSDEMVKGYDRLHSGIAFRQFVGYQYFGKSNLVNFYAGFEFNQALTYNRRQYNYDTRAYDQEQKFDIMSGFKVGWIIPFRSRETEEFYYY
ncbi:MAG: hypothetical protein WD530_04155 [Vicingaceae bacterium]